VVGFVARAATMAGLACRPLRFGLVLVSVEAAAAHGGGALPWPLECQYLDSGLITWAAELSKRGAIAYLEAEVEAGEGTQAAVVWRNGARVFGPERRERGPINQALRELGVTRRGDADEMTALGLVG